MLLPGWFRRLLLVIALSSCKPQLPEGVLDACVSDDDCADGLVCVTEIVEASAQGPALDTCQVPCGTDEECEFNVTCHSQCETTVAVPFCDIYSCR